MEGEKKDSLDYVAEAAQLRRHAPDASWLLGRLAASRLPAHGLAAQACGAGGRDGAPHAERRGGGHRRARESARRGANMAASIPTPNIEAAVARVVSRLVAASDDPSRRYRITILNSPVANAFALPGGYLYVTRGLIALTDDSSELAAVLSHEMAHVLLNHAVERAKVAEQADIVERVANDVLSDPQASQSARSGSRLTPGEILAQPGDRRRQGRHHHRRPGGLRSLRGLALPRQAGGLCGLPLRRRQPTTTRPASSPRTRARRSGAQLALVVARQFGAPGIGQRSEDRYLQALDGMVFGDDPSEGFVRGREFLHPRLAIAFEVPARLPPGEHQGSGAGGGRRGYRHALRRRDASTPTPSRPTISPPAGSTAW